MRLLVFNLAMDTDDPILAFTSDWVNALARRFETVEVVTMRAGRLAVDDNVRVHSLGKEKGYSEMRRALRFYRTLRRIFREGGVDVCFSHMAPVFTVMAAPVLRPRRVPIVTWYAHPSRTVMLRLAHAVSARMVASVASAYPYRKEKLAVVGQGIDTKVFAPDGSAPEDPLMVLCAGRLSAVKDHGTLLRAAALLRGRIGMPFRVVILGGPATAADVSYRATLERLAAALGVEDLVELHPPVVRSRLPEWYRRCAMHVNLTPAGFGDKTAWEAMACGRPCLAANPGFAETFGPLAPHLQFRHGDAGDLAHRMEAMLRMGEGGRAEIGSELRRQVEDMHSLEQLSRRLAALLRGVAGSGARR